MAPADARVVAAIDAAIADLEAAKTIFPTLREHASRRPANRVANVEAVDGIALLAFLRSLQGVQGATAGLRRRLPALAGVSGLPVRPALVEAPPVPSTTCAACGTARGPFRRGLCDRDRRRWERAGRPALTGFVETIRNHPPVPHPRAEGEHRAAAA